MTKLCLYFQMHQPHRLKRVRVFDIGAGNPEWFDEDLDRRILERVVERCYRPATRMLLGHAKRHGRTVRVAFGVTSTLMGQLEKAAPDVLDNLGELVASGSAEILGETSHHTLAWLFDREEFGRQVLLHREDVTRRFGVTPTVFRNTELLYDDALAAWLSARGYRAVLAEGADRVLRGRPATNVYSAATAPPLRVLLRHYRLSDDVGFRIENAAGGRPLRAATWARWIAASGGDSVNVGIDFETFGEHHGRTSMSLLAELPEALARAGVAMHLPREAALAEPSGAVAVPNSTSWADEARDESAWLGNPMQRAASQALYELLPRALAAGDDRLQDSWRRLATSDHAYYMSTKGFGDGQVHAHFRPYESPYEAHLNFMNALKAFALHPRLGREGDTMRSAA